MTTEATVPEREPEEATAVYLGRVLDGIGLRVMATSARAFHYDDYFCPESIDDGMNIHRLINELRSKMGSADPEQRRRILAVIDAAIDGRFDGTKEESDQWAASPEGQDVFRDLLGPPR